MPPEGMDRVSLAALGSFVIVERQTLPGTFLATGMLKNILERHIHALLGEEMDYGVNPPQTKINI